MESRTAVVPIVNVIFRLPATYEIAGATVKSVPIPVIVGVDPVQNCQPAGGDKVRPSAPMAKSPGVVSAMIILPRPVHEGEVPVTAVCAHTSKSETLVIETWAYPENPRQHSKATMKTIFTASMRVLYRVIEVNRNCKENFFISQALKFIINFFPNGR